MKTKILIAVLSIGLFTALIVKSQETKQTQIKQELIDVTYTCPMHADVKSDKPGTCPKCGMDLKEMGTSTTSQCCGGKDHSKNGMTDDSTKMKMQSNKTPQGCTRNDHSKMEMKTESTKTGDVTYACPMKCEGEKTYDKTGSCPKCKMDLKKVSDTKNASCCAGMDHSKMEMKMETPKMANATYACPMKCEGEKTYDKTGSCPKCKMDLKKTEIKKEK